MNPETKPIETESRTAFGIEWYATEEAAMARHCELRASDRPLAVYNGGWFDGMLCGRDHSFDRPGMFAVTVP